MNHQVHYEDDAMIIRIPTKCPAHLHNLLLRGITAMVKQQVRCPAENRQDAEAMSYMCELQNALLPSEKQLEKAFDG